MGAMPRGAGGPGVRRFLVGVTALCCGCAAPRRPSRPRAPLVGGTAAAAPVTLQTPGPHGLGTVPGASPPAARCPRACLWVQLGEVADEAAAPSPARADLLHDGLREAFARAADVVLAQPI